MPKITRTCPEAHAPRAASVASLASELRGFCLPCYEVGDFTLAAEPDGRSCVVHAALNHPARARTPPGHPPAARQRHGRAPRGRAARPPAPPPRPGVRARTVRRAAARRVDRAMAYGRRRAAARLTSGSYEAHPGWRHLIAEEYRVLVDQAEALARIEALVDAQEWRADRRAAWMAILRQLVHAMDWETGLVSAVTAERLGAAGGRAARTVSRVIAWARDVGLLVVVEHAASAEFLGTPAGRTPTYALVTNQPPPQPAAAEPVPHSPPSPPLTMVADENGDLPVSHVENKPLNGRRQPPANSESEDWPFYGAPRTPTERSWATRCLLRRLGLDGGGVSRVPLWRARALLKPWWEAGASPAGLLHAIDYHPDHPTHHRGDALRAARDPLRVLGARLRPWRHRLTELPPKVTGIVGDYRVAQAQRIARAAVEPSPDGPTCTTRSAASPATRAAARADVEDHLRRLRQRRSSGSPHLPL
ncbi:MAG: hypothetical protein AB7P47_23220 [Nocardioides sp.]